MNGMLENVLEAKPHNMKLELMMIWEKAIDMDSEI